MTETLDVQPASAGWTDFRRQLASLSRAFLDSTVRQHVTLIVAGLVAVVLLTAYGQIQLNAWNQPFYDALSQKNFNQFVHQLGVFAVIVVGLLVLNVSQSWLNLMLKLKLREGLVQELFEQWLKPGRAFRIAGAGEIGTNPDQRIHEDARHLTELSTDLGVGLFQASMLLVSFIGVLWVLSESVVFNVNGESFTVPGYMVWCALFYATTASFVSYLVGRPLFTLNADRYAQEAEFRVALVRLNEHIDDVTLARGEGDERVRLSRELSRVLAMMRRIVTAQTRLTWITAGYGWFTLIAPILVAAPGYFGGDLSFGQLMMVVGAFNQVQQSLRWSIDNFSTIADWRATFGRVATFRQAVIAMDLLEDNDLDQIEVVKSTDRRMVVDGLRITTPSGSIALDETHVEVGPGEHVEIVAPPGSGGHFVFQALAGLWPAGCGRVELPANADIAFMPRRPYTPPEALGSVLAYPHPRAKFSDGELAAVLEKVGLNRLIPSLDRTARWDRELAHEELQAIAFARVLLQRPDWIVIDQALRGLPDRGGKSVLDTLQSELPDAAILHIGRCDRSGFFNRSVHLIRDPGGPCLPAPEKLPAKSGESRKAPATAT
ncbi:glycosyl transferase family 1 [Acuticoccus sediminis]|uniref:Glycosyl transferase family 1 n=1 Tax=Acuticoccus sediminis TaxID=2184697 RepID=A0A8B2NJJ0_9HYPH|nr:ABC transporter ATP-binding protein/permease [Acuticoccus sediminis]RAH97400.1 glycosyl transferase family 1 [Acuticoccus sediminis]